MLRTALSAAAVVSAAAIDNGYGLLPPMGWRSWNCYKGNVNQDKMQRAMDGIVARDLTVDGVPTSLADLGFTAVGLDDNWQACGKGVNGSFHEESGEPLINTASFPNMTAMTDYGHARGLRIGWYANNCICRETHFKDSAYIARHMQRSAAAVARYGFDGLKLDGCGQFRNLTWWAQLLNATGRPVMIENCHWGETVPGQTRGDAPCHGDAGVSDCPYNFYRTSRDIRASWESVWHNLQSTVKFLGEPPLSRPGAWAYPDMLEVGNLKTHEEDRSHFSAWAITSSPLVLGFDVADASLRRKVWPIVSNKEVIAVSQTWAGHPGRLVKSAGGIIGEEHQIWAKKLSASEQAVLVLSNALLLSHKVTVDMTDLGFAANATIGIRDLYAHREVGRAVGHFETDSISARDSRMYIFRTL